MKLIPKQKSKTNGPRRRQEQRPTSNDLTERYSFQRNRTLTGSSSSRISSPNEGGAQLKSSRVHVHHLADTRRRIGSILGAVLLVSLGLYLLISQFTAKVSISIQDAPQISTQALYEPIVQDYFGQHPIERLRFLSSNKELTKYVQTRAPEIKTVETTPSSAFATSRITLKARQPITSWTIDGSRQYVDESGTAFSRNYFTDPNVQIVDNSGVPVTSGQAVASNRFLSFVGRLVGFSLKRGYAIEQVIIPAGTTRQVELNIKDIPYHIKCSIDRPAGEQAEDLDRTIKYLQQRGMTPPYVDIRVSGKAFYR